MKFPSLLTLLALFLCTSLAAQSVPERAGSRAKNRAENRANTRVDQKVDQAVDEAFNSIGSLFKKKKKEEDTSTSTTENTSTEAGSESEADASAMISGMMGGNSGPWVPYTNPYEFSMTMQVTEIKKNGKKEENSIDMAVTTNRFGIVMKDEEAKEVSRMILNTEDGKTTMITADKDGNKTGFRMRMPGMQNAMEQAAEDIDSDRFTFTKTGERKRIDGYDCEKYIVKDTKENTTTESWVTQDLGISAQDVFGSMMGMFGAARKQGAGASSALSGPYSGFPIMSVSTDGKSTYEVHFKNINVGADSVDQTILDTSGVPIQELGF